MRCVLRSQESLSIPLRKISIKIRQVDQSYMKKEPVLPDNHCLRKF